jgi:hypothetical protein
MSHVTDVKLKVHDLDALEKACTKLGLELRRDKKTYAWWGNFVGDSTPPAGRDPKDYGKGEHAIGRAGTTPCDGASGEWEIGLVPALDGNGYELMADTYGGPGRALLERAGPQFNTLRREYAAEVATSKAVEKLSRHGWRVQREELPGNKIRLRLRKR